MSKMIVLFRHGQAKNSFNTEDFYRKLTQNGISEIIQNTEKLKGMDINPDLIIASPAIRTKMTTEKICEVYNCKIIKFNNILYNNYTTNDFLEEVIYKIDNNFNTVFIVAHNPNISKIAQILSNEKYLFFNTGNIAVINFNTEIWEDISVYTGKLRTFIGL